MASKLRICALALMAFELVLQPFVASAGTTGSLNGRVYDSASGAPIAGAKVTAVSPSQVAATVTDHTGAYTFASLSPDTYTLTVEHEGYDMTQQRGVAVFADNAETIAIPLIKLKVIGRVQARASNDLIKPGVTSDVYSINASDAQAASALGGSAGVDQSYGAVVSVPGTNVPQGQQGWYQTLYIRGGDQDQVGYELDGIPVNRVYDNAPSTMFSNLGQQELQIYTGGVPSSSDASGISGYVNQVIKRGTTPGFSDVTLGIGGPAFYHKATIEVGGETLNRNFSYYLGSSMVNQDYRYLNNSNGAGAPGYFYPLYIPTNNGFVFDGSGTPIFAPGQSYAIATTQNRENIANLHWAIPHKDGITKDDVQLLAMTGEIWAYYFSSVNDLGGEGPVNGGSPVPWQDGFVYTGPVFAPPQSGAVQRYPFPSSPGHPLSAAFSDNTRDGNDNGVGIVKLQYQKNFNNRSYARVFAYTLYSNWFINGPLSAFLPYGAEVADYEISSHTGGLSASYANQISDKHFLTLSTFITGSHLQRYSTTGGFPSGTNGGSLSFITNDVDAAGNCYDMTGAISSCFAQANRGTMTNPIPFAAAPGTQWLVTENGYHANFNHVNSVFSAASFNDQWKLTDRLAFNVGLRVENFKYLLGDTADGYPARAFWFAAYNREHCFGPGLLQPITLSAPGAACPAGTSPTTLTNDSGGTISSTVWQPRLGVSFQQNVDNVFRASYGVYARPANTSWVQYDTKQQDLASYLGNQFLPYGYSSPRHDLRPDVSYNADASWEHHFKGTDYTFKLSPFYRSTHDQLQNFDINALTGLVSGLNVGHQTSYGVELAFRKGDFARDGLSWELGYTHTRSRIQYGAFANGRSVIDNLNSYVQEYNSYTQDCAPGAKPANVQAQLCGYNGNANAQPTFTNNGVTVANPYYNSHAQPLFDPNGSYTTYDIIPGPFAGANGYETPDVAALIVNYKTKRWTFTPSAVYSSGASYGSPLVWPGYIPQGCTGVIRGTAADPTTCVTASSNITQLPYIMTPDPYTGAFDNLGAFKEPSRFTLNMQIGYQASPRVAFSLTLAGIVDHCYQRGYPWDQPNICVYSQLPSSILAPAGWFAANPPAQLKYPYAVWLNNLNTGFVGTTMPFQAIFQVRMKL